jgi:hypothetical protein
MNLTILRNILAVVLGLLVGGIVNWLLLLLGGALIHNPAGFDASSNEAYLATMHLLKPQHFLFPFLGHAVGSFAGATVAVLIAANRKNIFALVVCSLFMLGNLANVFVIPSPAWFIFPDMLIAFLPMGWLAARIFAKGAAVKP